MYNKANMAHYSNLKAKRLTGSLLAAALFSVVHTFDFYPRCKQQRSMLETQMPTAAYKDSRSLYEALTKIQTTTENRLVIDLTMLWQSYEPRGTA